MTEQEEVMGGERYIQVDEYQVTHWAIAYPHGGRPVFWRKDRDEFYCFECHEPFPLTVESALDHIERHAGEDAPLVEVTRQRLKEVLSDRS